MVAYTRKRKMSSSVSSGRVAKKPRMTAKKVASIAKKAVLKTTETKKRSDELQLEDLVNTNQGIVVSSPLTLGTGTGHGTRIGHKVSPIGIDIRGHIISNSADFGLFVKFMVVREKNNLASPTVDLLETNAGNVSPTTNDISKLYRRVNTDSYEVLYSTIMNIPTEQYKRARLFRKWIPLRRFRTFTYDGSGAIEPAYNDIKIIVFGADAANDGKNIPFEVSYISTFYFKDP